MRLPTGLSRLVAQAVIRPLLSPRLPVRLRRRCLDLVGVALPSSRPVRRRRRRLGGVPVVTTAPMSQMSDGDSARGRPWCVMHLHGGGYLVGSAASHRRPIATLADLTRTSVHAVEYRLAPEHPYPAAVDDVEAVWTALTEQVPPERIAVVGDSAGGGLALALGLRLRAGGRALPGAFGLVSPWLDLSSRADSLRRNHHSDAMLNPDWLPLATEAYAGARHSAAELRPLEADLFGWPPLHVIAASGEILVDDTDVLVGRALAAGVEVHYRRVAGLWHDFCAFTGILAEADQAWEELGRFLVERVGSDSAGR